MCWLFVVVQSLSCVWLFVTPGTVAQQVPLSSTIFWSLLEFMSIELVMLSNHLILCCPLLLLPIILMSIICYSFFIISAALNCFIFPLILGYFEPMNLQRFSSSNQGRNKISWKSGAKETAFLSHLSWIWLLSGKKKNFACNAGDVSSIPGSGRSPGERNENPLQYSFLKNLIEESGRLQSMGSQKIQTQPSNWTTISKNISE